MNDQPSLSLAWHIIYFRESTTTICLWIQSTLIRLPSCIANCITACLRAEGIIEKHEHIALCLWLSAERRYPLESKRNKGWALFIIKKSWSKVSVSDGQLFPNQRFWLEPASSCPFGFLEKQVLQCNFVLTEQLLPFRVLNIMSVWRYKFQIQTASQHNLLFSYPDIYF